MSESPGKIKSTIFKICQNQNQENEQFLQWSEYAPLPTYWSLNPQSNGIWRWGPLGDNEAELMHEYGASGMGSVSSLRVLRIHAPCSLLSTTGGSNEKLQSATYPEGEPHQNSSSWYPDPGLPASRTVKNKFLLFISQSIILFVTAAWMSC